MKRRHTIQKTTALLLALTLLLTACGPERPPITISPTNPVVTTTAAQDVTEPSTDPAETTSADWRAEARGLSDEPEELPEWPYHSEALDFSPAEGIRITAEAGALYDDTEITLTPVTEDSERLIRIAEDFEDYGEPLIGAWEVHAGLEEDEHLPGEYTVSIDLSTLDLDESLWPAVRLYRLTDGGKLTAYSTELEGSILSYSSDQNSITLASVGTSIVVGAALGLPLYYGIEKIKADWYYWDWTGASYHHGKNKYGSYTIKWSMKDVDPKQQEKNDRMLEIAKEYKPKAEKDYEQEKKDRADTVPHVHQHQVRGGAVEGLSGAGQGISEDRSISEDAGADRCGGGSHRPGLRLPGRRRVRSHAEERSDVPPEAYGRQG